MSTNRIDRVVLQSSLQAIKVDFKVEKLELDTCVISSAQGKPQAAKMNRALCFHKRKSEGERTKMISDMSCDAIERGKVS